MIKTIQKFTIVFFAIALIAGCARDLSSSTYTSDATMNLTLQGKVVSVRPVTIKGSDKLSDNSTGALAGGSLGAVAASGVGGSSATTGVAMIGAGIAGAVAGSMIEGKLGTSNGLEYIVQIDTSKLKNMDDYYVGSKAMRNALASASTSGLITIIQGIDNPLTEGQKVFVILGEKRTRVIAIPS